MARTTIAALQTQLATVTRERDEAVDALHRLRDEVIAARLAEQAALYAQRPSRHAAQQRTFMYRGQLCAKVLVDASRRIYAIRPVEVQ